MNDEAGAEHDTSFVYEQEIGRIDDGLEGLLNHWPPKERRISREMIRRWISLVPS